MCNANGGAARIFWLNEKCDGRESGRNKWTTTKVKWKKKQKSKRSRPADTAFVFTLSSLVHANELINNNNNNNNITIIIVGWVENVPLFFPCSNVRCQWDWVGVLSEWCMVHGNVADLWYYAKPLQWCHIVWLWFRFLKSRSSFATAA